MIYKINLFDKEGREQFYFNTGGIQGHIRSSTDDRDRLN